jgi:hypothetical protein
LKPGAWILDAIAPGAQVRDLVVAAVVALGGARHARCPSSVTRIAAAATDLALRVAYRTADRAQGGLRGGARRRQPGSSDRQTEQRSSGEPTAARTVAAMAESSSRTVREPSHDPEELMLLSMAFVFFCQAQRATNES